jgi:lipopolysaccharide/colanic/teichoic acid biosynthesis glycosyltransferase
MFPIPWAPWSQASAQNPRGKREYPLLDLIDVQADDELGSDEFLVKGLRSVHDQVRLNPSRTYSQAPPKQSNTMAASDDRKFTLVLDFPVMTQGVEEGDSSQAPVLAPHTFDLIYAVDKVAALLLFLLTLPVLLLSMLWVLIVDRGNPIFSQIRIGLGGQPFRLYKIRSMSHDHHGHARFCAHGDERILPGGQFLRKTRIDELPQLLNVLRGDMALVGPRPEQPVFVTAFIKEIPRYGERVRVKPGITGLAQITQGYVDSLHGTRIKLEFDLAYIEQRSIRLWFRIIMGTVKVVILGNGAR